MPESRPALVIPVWNQWPVTETFLASFQQDPAADLIVVDNGSTDATARSLAAWRRKLPLMVIKNRRNLGCAPAWNQGVRAALRRKAPWIGVLNNDLVLPAGWLQPLLRRAVQRGWHLASPATREGRLDYDLASYARQFVMACGGWDEPGFFGWCFLVRRGAFEKVGFFDESFKMGIGEDEDFVRRLEASGLKAGISGCAFVHHFGSATLKALKAERGSGFEKENLKLLFERWGEPVRRGPAGKLKTFLKRSYQRIRWGHLLKE
jgi:GT2 family glycosyltransferase